MRDARDVEQVVDQAHQVPHLPLHRLHGALDPLRPRLRPRPDGAQKVQRADDGRERVAQLVRQQREELVLAPIGLGQLGGAVRCTSAVRRARSSAIAT